MSYQFDTRELQVDAQAKPVRTTTQARLLTRRTARQERRAIRAI